MVRVAYEQIQSCRQVAIDIGLPIFAKLTSGLIAVGLVDYSYDIGEEDSSPVEDGVANL